MEAEPVYACLAPSVPGVAGDGAPHIGHVESYLRPPAGVYLDSYQRVGGAPLLQLPVSYRLPACALAVLHESDSHVLGLLDTCLHGARLGAGGTVHDRMVDPLYRPVLELRLEDVPSLGVTRYQKAPGRLAV